VRSVPSRGLIVVRPHHGSLNSPDARHGAPTLQVLIGDSLSGFVERVSVAQSASTPTLLPSTIADANAGISATAPPSSPLPSSPGGGSGRPLTPHSASAAGGGTTPPGAGAPHSAAALAECGASVASVSTTASLLSTISSPARGLRAPRAASAKGARSSSPSAPRRVRSPDRRGRGGGGSGDGDGARPGTAPAATPGGTLPKKAAAANGGDGAAAEGGYCPTRAPQPRAPPPSKLAKGGSTRLPTLFGDLNGEGDTFIDLFGDINPKDDNDEEGGSGGPSRSTRAMARAHVDAAKCSGLKDIVSTVQVGLVHTVTHRYTDLRASPRPSRCFVSFRRSRPRGALFVRALKTAGRAIAEASPCAEHCSRDHRSVVACGALLPRRA